MRITIASIQRAVAVRYDLRLADMTSSERTWRVSHPRQVAMYLAKRLSPFGRPTIGARFGGRDSSTVFYAIQKVRARREVDTALDRDIATLLLDLMAPLAEVPENPIDEFLIFAGVAIRRDALPSFPKTQGEGARHG